MTPTAPLGITDDRVLLKESVQDWREAIDLVGSILVENGDTTEAYIDSIAQSIAGPNGTYIDLGSGIALAHSRPENGVKTSGVAVLHLATPVLLADEPSHPISVFIALAAEDSTSHLSLMRTLATALTDLERRESLLEATTPADIVSALTPKE